MTSSKRRKDTSARSPKATSCWLPGKELDEVCRRLDVAESTWNWCLAQYNGMKANDAKRSKELEVANAR